MPSEPRQPARESRPDGGIDRASRAAFLLLIAVTVAAPFSYGPAMSDRRLAWLSGNFTSAGALRLVFAAFLVAGMTLLSRCPLTLSNPIAPALGALAALVLLGALQLVPLPEGILGTVAPVNLQIYHETVEMLRLFGSPAAPAAISIAPPDTLGAVLLLLACGALLLSAAALLNTRPRRRIFSGALIATALVQAAPAITRAGSGGLPPGKVSAYLEIALGAAFGVLWGEVLTNRDRVGDVQGKAERFERRLPSLAAKALIGLLVAGAIVAAGSRAAMLAASLGMVTVAALGFLHRRSRRRGRAATATTVAILLGGLTLGVAVAAPRLSDFLESGPRSESDWPRLVIWQSDLEAVRHFPVVGSGLGTFPDAFRRVQPRSLVGEIGDSNSDLFDIAVTSGVTGLTLALATFGLLSAGLLRLWRRQMHREESAFVLGGFGALLCLGIQGLADSNLSVPVISVTLAILVGASWAAGARR